MLMAYVMQAGLVREIADLVDGYRKGHPALVKFGMKCGLALNKTPIAGGIMHSPKAKDERFQIGDKAFGGKFASDKDAFFGAFGQFTGHGQFLAWNGKTPDDGKFDLVKDMSENFAHPTMQVEVIYRKRGEDAESRLNMFFIGFADNAAAEDYAARNAAIVM
jgi:hypothetical protein